MAIKTKCLNTELDKASSQTFLQYDRNESQMDKHPMTFRKINDLKINMILKTFYFYILMI